MTSHGHAYTRFRRAIAEPRSATVIRSAAAKLPGPVALDDALELCLAFLELQPATFDAAGARWAARLVLEHRLGLADAQLAFAAIAALSRGERRAGAQALICLSERYGLEGGERILTGWLQRHGLAL